MKPNHPRRLPIGEHDDLASEHAELLAFAVDEFTALANAETNVDVEVFLGRFPLIANTLRELLPALQVLKQPHRPAPLTSVPLAPREVLGDFRLGRELGRGGMGIVYEAEEISLGRKVALKVLPYAAVLDERYLARFKNEARAAATLKHQHIVPVYSIGTERGVHYYAMQLIEGKSLAQLIDHLRSLSSRVSPNEIVSTVNARDLTAMSALTTRWQDDPPAYMTAIAQIGCDAAEALEYAHQQGIVHRDIKPANLLLGEEGQVWITDFGLARRENDDSLTASGDLLGTLRYMSPEQAGGEHGIVDQRTDVYSLAVTLYELLTLQPANPGRTRAELLQHVQFGQPTPCGRLNRRIPRDLEVIIHRAMDVMPEARYQTAGELAQDLRRFVHGEPVLAKSMKWSQRLARKVRRYPGRFTATLGVLLWIVVLALSGLVVINGERRVTQSALKSEHEQRIRADANLRLARDTLYDAFIKQADELTDQPQMTALQQEVCEQVVDFYTKLTLADAQDPEMMRGKALAYVRLADVYRLTGRLSECSSAENAAETVLRELREQHTATTSDLLQGVELNLQRAETALNHGDASTAGRLHRAAEAELSEVPKSLSRAERQRCDLASLSLDSLRAALARRRGDSKAAAEAYKAAMSTIHLAEPSLSVEQQLRFAGVETAYASWLHETQGDRAALAIYRAAIARTEVIARRDPRRLQVRKLLAQSLNDLAIMEKSLGDLSAAQQDVTLAVERWQSLTRDFPQTPGLQLGYATAMINRAAIDHDRREYAAAQALLETSLKIAESLVMSFPDQPRYRECLATVYHNLATNLRRLDRAADHENADRAAVEQWRHLVDEFPQEANYQLRLAQAYRSWANELGPDASLPLFDRAASVLYQLQQLNPDVPEYMSQLCSLYEQRGTRQDALGENRLAEADYQSALAVANELCNRWSHVPEYAAQQSHRRRKLAEHYLNRNQWGRAIEELQTSVSLEQSIAARFPKFEDSRFVTPLSTLHLSWAHCLTRQHGVNFPEAQNHYQQAARIAADAGTTGRVLGSLGLGLDDTDAIAFLEATRRIGSTAGQGMPPVPPSIRFSVLVDLANRLVRAERWDDAARVIEEGRELAASAVETQPAATNVFICLQTLTWPDSKRWESTTNLALARKLITVAPREAAYWNTLASAHVSRQQWTEAIQILEHTIELRGNPSRYDCVLMAYCYRKLGNNSQAERWLLELSRLSPGGAADIALSRWTEAAGTVEGDKGDGQR